jgi:hypothetical protein
MVMNKGMISKLIPLAFLLLPLAAFSQGEIYKVVDKDGNVTFTDQPPVEGAQPMDLPPLSVVESDVQVPEAPPGGANAAADEPKPPTTKELRRQFRDFRITQPQHEETFWGTGNTVVVSWGSSQPISPEMSVTLFVDGQGQKAPGAGGVTLTLDRGEHQVYAELRDGRNRRIVTTDTVTFFVKQHSVNFNRPNIGRRNGGS